MRTKETIQLEAGPLKLTFNPTEGSIHHLIVEGHEVLRGISAPVRDPVWATVTPSVENIEFKQQGRTFKLRFDCHCRNEAIDFRWTGDISGDENGTVVFSFDGEAQSDFERNRIGICVLHPAHLSGAPCKVEHVDGSTEAGSFPRHIAPKSPFTDIRAIRHHVSANLAVEVRCEGEAFEMEDQRNWTDASFKTYCTPLRLARPAKVKRGTRISQRTTVRLIGVVKPREASVSASPPEPLEVQLKIGAATQTKLPTLGTVWDLIVINEQLLKVLRPLRLSHLRVDLWFDDPVWTARLLSAARAATVLEAKLELALFVQADAASEIARVERELTRISPAPLIARWLIYDAAAACTPPALLDAVRSALVGSAFRAPVGGGAVDNFAELNFEPAVATEADFTVHGLNPQVHAFDTVSIFETLAIHGTTVENARHLSGGRPVIVSPVTFHRRARAGEPEANDQQAPNTWPFKIDERQATELAQAWTLGSLVNLASHRADSITYFRVQGIDGLVEGDGLPFPVAEVLRSVALARDGVLMEVTNSHPDCLAALAIQHGAQQHVLLANLSARSLSVHLLGIERAMAPFTFLHVIET